jgi:hypothetical protein
VWSDTFLTWQLKDSRWRWRWKHSYSRPAEVAQVPLPALARHLLHTQQLLGMVLNR